MTTKDLQEASKILRANIPSPRVQKTVDVYKDLTAMQRQVLFETDRMLVKRLMQINPR